MLTYDVDIVIFDCDSTLSSIEGIDELARKAGMFEQLSTLTNAAMDGKMKLDEVYKQRLQMIRPAREDIDWLAHRYLETIVPDASTVIESLHNNGKSVHIVSGGIRQAVLPLASYLKIPDSQVHAVELFFSADGVYAGYDETSPLARNGGKKFVCAEITGDEWTAVMIGDGITDLEAAQDRVQFIGFGGVIRRDAVEKKVTDYITDYSLLPLQQRLIQQTSDA